VKDIESVGNRIDLSNYAHLTPKAPAAIDIARRWRSALNYAIDDDAWEMALELVREKYRVLPPSQ
jgi:hypothetical protein